MTWPVLDTTVKRTLASAAALAAAFVVTRAVLSRFARPPQIAEASAGQAVKWMLNKAGDISQLRLVPVPPSSVERNCVRVAVRFVGLNFADICACQGLYSATPSGAFTPGLEFSGVVTETGANVSNVKVGDSVMGVTRFGGYTQEIVVECRQVFAVPEGWSLADAAAFLCTSLTAWYGLHKIGHLQTGQLVAIQSAAGGVGLAATEIVLGAGAVPLCIVGSEAKVHVLLERFSALSRNNIVVRRDDAEQFGRDLHQAVQQLRPGCEGVDLVFDSVMGAHFHPLYCNMRRGGTMVVFGAASFIAPGAVPNYFKLALQYLRRPRLDVLEMIAQNKGVFGFNLIWMWDKMDLMRDMLADMFLRMTWLSPHVGHTLPFPDAHQALALLQSGKTTGKVLLEVNRQ